MTNPFSEHNVHRFLGNAHIIEAVIFDVPPIHLRVLQIHVTFDGQITERFDFVDFLLLCVVLVVRLHCYAERFVENGFQFGKVCVDVVVDNGV